MNDSRIRRSMLLDVLALQYCLVSDLEISFRHFVCRDEKSRNFANLGHGNPGKVREFYS